MLRSRLAAFAVAALAFVSASFAHAAPLTDTTAVLHAARALTPSISKGEAGPLWQHFDARMREASKDSVTFAAQMDRIHGQIGELASIERELVLSQGGYWVYTARSRFTKAPVPLDMVLAFDADGRVGGMFVRPSTDTKATEYPSTHLNDVTKTRLHLPFRGEWTVIWGGRTVAQNYHAIARDQRFAHDLVILKDGSSHTGEGKALTDYYAYGQEILAPAAGTVVWAVDTLADQPIGSTDIAHPAGNSLVIDHGNGEYSLIAHLQPHSVRFKVGARVAMGVVVGKCGNSGNTSEPHLHYHLQNGPKPLDADGLPAQFVDLVVDGKPVARAEIVKGQVVKNSK